MIAPKNYKPYSDNYYITLSPFSGSDYFSLKVFENKYGTKERNLEGIPNIVSINEQDREENTILSIPEIITDTTNISSNASMCFCITKCFILYIFKCIFSLLHYAVNFGFYNVIFALVEIYHADINKHNKLGHTPFYYIVSKS